MLLAVTEHLNRHTSRSDGFMKRHLFFVAALSVYFYALNVAVYGQEVPRARAAASGGDISRTNIVIIPQEKVEELVRDVRRLREGLTPQQRENVALLRKKLDLNEAQVLAALDILAENNISLEFLVVKLVEIAGRFQALGRALSPLPGDDSETSALEAEALKAIGAGELSTADALIADVETKQRHILDQAGTLAKRGEIERTPSLWTIAVGSQGVALMHLAERRADAALAEGALNLINTAVELMRAGNEPSAVAYYERQLATARTSALRLRGPTSR
jgi:hypothetical protein